MSEAEHSRRYPVLGFIMPRRGYLATPLIIGANVAVFLGPTLLATLWLVIYSYLVWRRDRDRVPPSGTAPAEE